MEYHEKPINSLEDAIDEGYISEEIKDIKQMKQSDWRDLSRAIMTIDFIRTHADKLDWEVVFVENVLSIEEIDEFSQYFDRHAWKEVCYRDDLSSDFITRHYDKLDFDIIILKNKIPAKILVKAIKDMKTDYRAIFEHHPLTPNTIRILQRFSPDFSWYEICKEKDLPVKTVEKFLYEINWSTYCRYRKLSENFIERFQENVDWKVVSKYQTMSKEFIIKHGDKIYIDDLMENASINLPHLEETGVITMLRLVK